MKRGFDKIDVLELLKIKQHLTKKKYNNYKQRYKYALEKRKRNTNETSQNNENRVQKRISNTLTLRKDFQTAQSSSPTTPTTPISKIKSTTDGPDEINGILDTNIINAENISQPSQKIRKSPDNKSLSQNILTNTKEKKTTISPSAHSEVQVVIEPKPAMVIKKPGKIVEKPNLKSSTIANPPVVKQSQKTVVFDMEIDQPIDPPTATDNSVLVKKIIDSFTPKTQDRSRTDLTPLRAMEELSEKEPFNMSRFLDSIPLTGLSFLDLMQLSASARRKLSEVLKIVLKNEYHTLLAKCPSLQQLNLDEDKNYQILRNDNPSLEPAEVLNLYTTCNQVITNNEVNNWTNGIVPTHNIQLEVPSLSDAGNTAATSHILDQVVENNEESDEEENIDEEIMDNDIEENTNIFYNKLLQMYPDIKFISSKEMEKEIENKENKIAILTVNYSKNAQQSNPSMHHEYQTKADSVQDFFIKMQKMKNFSTNITDPIEKTVEINKIWKLKKIEVPYLEEINTENNSDVGVKNLNITSYNVNSIRNIMKKSPDELPKLFKGHNIVCLQEVRLLEDQINKLDLPFAQDFSSYWSTCEEKKGYSSVATFIHKSLKVKNIRHTLDGYTEESMEGRYLEIELENNIVIINVYFPNGRMPERAKYKEEFNNCFLQRYLTISKENKTIILSCDLNIAHAEEDINRIAKENILGNSGFEDNERKWVDKLIEAGLLDTWRSKHPKENDKFTTWLGWRNARPRNIGMRFDYIYVTNNSNVEVKKSNHLYDYNGSDHIPIETTITIWYETPLKVYSLYNNESVQDISEDDVPPPILEDDTSFQIDGICEDEFLKSLNIIHENGKYYKVVGNGDSEVKVYIRPRRDEKPTPTEDFIVGEFVFQIAKDVPQHAKDKMRKVLQNRECFVQKGIPGRTFTNVPEVVLEHNPPENYKFPYLGSKTWKPGLTLTLDKLEILLGKFDNIIKFDIDPTNNILPIYDTDLANTNNILIIPPITYIKDTIIFAMKNKDTLQTTVIIPDFVLINNDELLQEMLTKTNVTPILIIHEEDMFNKHLCPIWKETFAWTFNADGGISAQTVEQLTCTFDAPIINSDSSGSSNSLGKRM